MFPSQQCNKYKQAKESSKWTIFYEPRTFQSSSLSFLAWQEAPTWLTSPPCYIETCKMSNVMVSHFFQFLVLFYAAASLSSFICPSFDAIGNFVNCLYQTVGYCQALLSKYNWTKFERSYWWHSHWQWNEWERGKRCPVAMRRQFVKRLFKSSKLL